MKKKKPVARRMTFYPGAPLLELLDEVPAKKLTQRINDLLEKGLRWERREQMAQGYEHYGVALAGRSPQEIAEDSRDNALWVAKLFEDEDSDDEDLV